MVLMKRVFDSGRCVSFYNGWNGVEEEPRSALVWADVTSYLHRKLI